MAKKKLKKKGKKKTEEEKERRLAKKEQIKKENIILRNFLIGIGVVIIAIIVFVFISYSSTHFKYENVKFQVIREGEIIFYKTELPVIYQGERQKYNFYLRKDPRIVGENVAFDGEVVFKQNMVINSTGDFNCDGDDVIAIANFVNLHTLAGIDVIKDENASCDPDGLYMFVQLREGNETSVEKFGPACYYININNCEILEGTERFMLETFLKLNELF